MEWSKSFLPETSKNVKTMMAKSARPEIRLQSWSRNLFTKSISTTRDLEKGEIVTKDLLILKKPGTGINASNLELIIGMKAKNKIYSNKLLTWDDLEK